MPRLTARSSTAVRIAGRDASAEERRVMTTTRPAHVRDGDKPADGESALLAELAAALHRVRRGRFDVRLPRREGVAGEVVDQFNEMVGIAERGNRDLLRISRVVGREGRTSDRLDEESYEGEWATGVHAVNVLIDSL